MPRFNCYVTLCNSHDQRVNPIKSHEEPPFSHGFPMGFPINSMILSVPGVHLGPKFPALGFFDSSWGLRHVQASRRDVGDALRCLLIDILWLFHTNYVLFILTTVYIMLYYIMCWYLLLSIAILEQTDYTYIYIFIYIYIHDNYEMYAVYVCLSGGASNPDLQTVRRPSWQATSLPPGRSWGCCVFGAAWLWSTPVDESGEIETTSLRPKPIDDG